MDIFSKKNEPYREDVQAKRLISENKATIHKLADVFSNGAYSASQRAKAKTAQKPEESIAPSRFHILGAGKAPSKPEPYVKVSLNGRFVLADGSTGKQLNLLGQYKFRNGQKYFCLATEENGFISPVDLDTETALKPLDGVVVENSTIESKVLDFMRRALEIP